MRPHRAIWITSSGTLLELARTTDFHGHRREFERLREEAEERGAGLWGACPEIEGY